MVEKKQVIWVIIEQVQGKTAAVSLEVLGKACQLAAEAANAQVVAVALGSAIGPLAQQLPKHGADKVFLVDDPRLELYQNDTYSSVLRRLIERERPDVVLIGASASGEELAPTLAAQLGTGLAAHCTNLRLAADGTLTMLVPAFGGQVIGEIFCPVQRPQMATIKPGVFSPVGLAERTGEIVQEDGASLLYDAEIRLRATRLVVEEPPGMPIEQADVIVAGGWGIGSRENWRLLEELAKEFNGAVGCTRPALDQGWTGGEHTMIGSSGKTVRPKLYLGAGISGAAHHMVGIKDSGVIISVNRDKTAPIFQFSDYCVAADFRDVLPELLAQIRRAKH